jgi:hypothetical protein
MPSNRPDAVRHKAGKAIRSDIVASAYGYYIVDLSDR